MLENGDDEQNSDGMTKWRTVDEHVGHLNYTIFPWSPASLWSNIKIFSY